MWWVKYYLVIGFFWGIQALIIIHKSFVSYDKYNRQRDRSFIKDVLCTISEEMRDTKINENPYLVSGIIVALCTFFWLPIFLELILLSQNKVKFPFLSILRKRISGHTKTLENWTKKLENLRKRLGG